MISDFKSRLSELNAVFGFDISAESSLNVGGEVAAFITADSIEELAEIYGLCTRQKLSFMVIGEGTNVLFNEGFLNFVVVKLGKSFKYFRIGGDRIEAGAAYSLQKFVIDAAKQGYDFSALAGIPGTLGGAVYGNSGDICSYVISIDCLFEGGRRGKVRIGKANYSYRRLEVAGLKAILSIQFKAPKSDSNAIFKKIRDQIKQKKKTQPLKDKSGGCFFKNPSGLSAGKLIEGCGLKSFRYGGAAVSAKHANFIINLGNASADDIYVLSAIIRDMVYLKYDVWLENEVRMIGFKNAKHG